MDEFAAGNLSLFGGNKLVDNTTLSPDFVRRFAVVGGPDHCTERLLELAEKLEVLAVDKTGTLTEGRPVLTELIPVGASSDAGRLLRLAASLEQGSTHPLAAAIVNRAGAAGSHRFRNGDKDLQVASKPNLKGIETALKAGGNKDFKIVEMPNMNHLFQTSSTGNIAEYGQLEETFSPKVLELMKNWILEK